MKRLTKEKKALLLELYNDGQFEAAQSLASDLVKDNTESVFLLKFLTACCQLNNNLDQALRWAQRAVRFAPKDGESWCNLSVLLGLMEHFSEAETAARTGLTLGYNTPDINAALGYALYSQGAYFDALDPYRFAIDANDRHLRAWLGLGDVYKKLGYVSQAIEHYKKITKLFPEHYQVFMNAGTFFQSIARIREARNCYDRAVELAPNVPENWYNLANFYSAQVMRSQAFGAYKRALKLNPTYLEARLNYGLLLAITGDSEGALEELRLAYQQNPTNLLVTSALILHLMYSGGQSESSRLATAYFNRLAEPYLAHQSRRTKPGALKRIGYISADLIEHSVAFFILDILRHHNRDAFTIYAYSNNPRKDHVTKQIASHVDHWRDCFAMSDDELAEQIRRDEIDILVDLSGHTAGNRLLVFARKPAPVQVTWIGFPGTTGLKAMDYIIGDPYVTPCSEREHFTETPWQLPETYLCFTPPTDGIEVGPLPALENGYVTFGCFNNLGKIGENVIQVWAEILIASPSSKLFLKTKALQDSGVIDRIINSFTEKGVSNNRLILEGPSKRSELLASYQRVDIALDPFPYPGGTTSAESLWMGVPVLTRRGNSFVSHVGESIANNTGQTNWVADDEADYVAKAIAFSADLESLSNLRRSLRTQVLKSPLFDAPRFVKHFEEALFKMYKEKCNA